MTGSSQKRQLISFGFRTRDARGRKSNSDLLVQKKKRIYESRGEGGARKAKAVLTREVHERLDSSAALWNKWIEKTVR